jgi:hypothetical protein
MALVALRLQGQPWWCRCGRPFLCSGNVWSEHNSQHLFDPYSFTHIIHGLLLFAVLRPLSSRLGLDARLVLAIALECLWEIAENSETIIQRYRHATLALGYTGDSLMNSLGDIACCGVGFLLAARFPVRWSVALFLTIEVGLLVIYRDCFLLNTLMLVWPIQAIKTWQMAISP